MMDKGMPISKYAFPNATTLAEFRPHSFTIHFHETTAEEYKEILDRPTKIVADRRPLQTLAHELTHWSDAVSSVWGQHYINKLFKTFDVISAQDEEQFYKYISFFDEDRRIMLPRYYHVVERERRKHSAKLPWRISFSCGQEFDADGRINYARPIFFVRFDDNIDGRRIARQPISVGSLLETTAVWAELTMAAIVLKSMSHDDSVVERRIFETERMSDLYNKDLTLYTAPAHMLAHFCRIPDLFWTYERAALLSSVALNLTEKYFPSMRHPKRFEPFGARRKSFLKAENRGYIFASLAAHASDVPSTADLDVWLKSVLDAAGLPAYPELCESALTSLTIFPSQKIRDPRSEEVRQTLLSIGRERCEARAKRSATFKSFDALGFQDSALPLLIDANAELFAVGWCHLRSQQFDQQTMISFEYALDGAIDNFLQGCRGLG